MGKESFLLVSLKENKAHKLAQVISNPTSRKILDFLAENKATETTISKELGIPLSTVHYNLQQLVGAKLVKADEFHYSEKGKEVNHYTLANRYIIITPEKVTGIKQKLRSILPAGLITLTTAGLIQLYLSRLHLTHSVAVKQGVAREAGALLSAAAPEAADAASTAINLAAQPSIVLWFLIGAAFVIMIYLIIEWLQEKK